MLKKMLNRKTFNECIKKMLNIIGTDDENILIFNDIFFNFEFNIERKIFDILVKILNIGDNDMDQLKILFKTPPIYKYIKKYNNKNNLIIVPYSDIEKYKVTQHICSVQHIKYSIINTKNNIVFYNILKFLQNDKFVKLLSFFLGKKKILIEHYVLNNKYKNYIIYIILYVDSIFLGLPNYNYLKYINNIKEIESKLNYINKNTITKSTYINISKYNNMVKEIELLHNGNKNEIAFIINLPPYSKNNYDKNIYDKYKLFIKFMRKYFNNIIVIYKSYKISHIQDYILNIDINDHNDNHVFEKKISKKNINMILNEIEKLSKININKIFLIELHSFREYKKKC